jgi:hypothetical protein
MKEEEEEEEKRDVWKEWDYVRYGWQEGAGSCCSLSLSKLMGFVHAGVVEILTLTVLDLLNLAGEGCMLVRHTH